MGGKRPQLRNSLYWQYLYIFIGNVSKERAEFIFNSLHLKKVWGCKGPFVPLGVSSSWKSVTSCTFQRTTDTAQCAEKWRTTAPGFFCGAAEPKGWPSSKGSACRSVWLEWSLGQVVTGKIQYRKIIKNKTNHQKTPKNRSKKPWLAERCNFFVHFQHQHEFSYTVRSVCLLFLKKMKLVL